LPIALAADFKQCPLQANGHDEHSNLRANPKLFTSEKQEQSFGNGKFLAPQHHDLADVAVRPAMAGFYTNLPQEAYFLQVSSIEPSRLTYTPDAMGASPVRFR
jgi:hypothetical protein